jgi:S-adenosylmethionine/arginine decarboxylase-like enzyme
MIRAEISSPPKDTRYIKKWVRKLVHLIKMKMLGKPIAYYCNKEGNRGLTCVTVIETSHIAFHCWDECTPALLQLDVYTCSELDETAIFKHIETFKPTTIKYKYYDRENNFTLIKET